MDPPYTLRPDGSIDASGQLSAEDEREAGQTPVLAQAAFERWVLVDGKRTALIAGPRAISYHELNRQADAIAHALVGAGVLPGQFVGICLPRSVPQIAAVLGALKAGAACLPLDPTGPAKRIQAICQDALTPLILTSA